MAYPIPKAAKLVLGLLDANGIEVETPERCRMAQYGLASIGGFTCRIANTLTLHSAKIIVNTAWFNARHPNYDKPYMQRGTDSSRIDFQLILGHKKVHALHFLDLRHYSLFLEKDREHWFGQSHWGIQTNEDADSFSWEGGNTMSFPFLNLTNTVVLQRRNSEVFNGMCH